MSVLPRELDDGRPEDGFAAAEIARVNLSYDARSDWQWRKIAIWAVLIVWALALVLLARRLFL